MPVTKAHIKATAKWEAKAYDKTLLRMKKGKREEIDAHIAVSGESLNAFINRAIDEALARGRIQA